MSKPKRRNLAASGQEASGPPALPLAATLQQAATSQPEKAASRQPGTRRRQEDRQGLLNLRVATHPPGADADGGRKRTTMQALCASAIDRLVQEAPQE